MNWFFYPKSITWIEVNVPRLLLHKERMHNKHQNYTPQIKSHIFGQTGKTCRTLTFHIYNQSLPSSFFFKNKVLITGCQFFKQITDLFFPYEIYFSFDMNVHGDYDKKHMIMCSAQYKSFIPRSHYRYYLLITLIYIILTRNGVFHYGKITPKYKPMCERNTVYLFCINLVAEAFCSKFTHCIFYQ